MGMEMNMVVATVIMMVFVSMNPKRFAQRPGADRDQHDTD
jgi:hypothetical protein